MAPLATRLLALLGLVAVASAFLPSLVPQRAGLGLSSYPKAVAPVRNAKALAGPPRCPECD